MTDLEALECIVVDLTSKAKEHNKEKIEQLEKSLEVLEQLEILKKYYSPFREFLEEMFEKGHNEDLTKVKEWLENE